MDKADLAIAVSCITTYMNISFDKVGFIAAWNKYLREKRDAAFINNDYKELEDIVSRFDWKDAIQLETTEVIPWVGRMLETNEVIDFCRNVDYVIDFSTKVIPSISDEELKNLEKTIAFIIEMQYRVLKFGDNDNYIDMFNDTVKSTKRILTK